MIWYDFRLGTYSLQFSITLFQQPANRNAARGLLFMLWRGDHVMLIVDVGHCIVTSLVLLSVWHPLGYFKIFLVQNFRCSKRAGVTHTKRISESWRRFPFVARSARVAPKNWVSSPQSISKCTLTLSRSWFHFAGKYTLIWANTTRAYKISQTSVVSVVYKRNLRSFLWSLRRQEKSEICANHTFNKH